MENPSHSVCLIENAIDRLIEYGDRIHASQNKFIPKDHQGLKTKAHRPEGFTTTRSRSLDISVSKGGKRSRTGPSPSARSRGRSASSSIKGGRHRSCSCTGTRTCYCSQVSQPEDEPELRVASPTPSESLVTERETKNNFLYTVLKGNRRCTIPGTMYSKRLPDSWIRIHFMLHDEDGTQLLDLKTDLLGEALRNTIVNGKPTEFL